MSATDRFDSARPGPVRQVDYEALAALRYGLRKFLRFSKDTLAQHDLTPEQYEALLALRGFGPPEGLTIGQLSERLQVKHHSAVSLVAKLVRAGLVHRKVGRDRREVYLRLSNTGEALLGRMAALHLAWLRERANELISALERVRECGPA
jgi:DNA-binding MarR family transcriptional regulator